MADLRVPELNLADQPVQEMDRAASELGIFTVTGHGVPSQVMEKAHAAAVALFALPAEIKSAHVSGGLGFRPLEAEALGRYRTPEAAPDRKETFTARFDGDVPWPATVPGAREALHHYHAAMVTVSDRLLGLAEGALRLAPGTLIRLCADPSGVLRALHYPESDGEGPRAGAHTDFGSLTALSTSGDSPGLQIRTHTGWQNVDAPPGSLLIHLGEIFGRWTVGRWRAPLHRVAGAGDDRYTLAWFHAPNREAAIAPLEPFRAEGTDDQPVTVGALLSARARAQSDVNVRR